MHGDPRLQSTVLPTTSSVQKYPLQFLCDLAYAVFDDETGDLLEFCHLMKHPKHRDVWTKSFGTEIRCLATTTETISFIKKDAIPQERRGDETYARIVCTYQDGKKDKYRTRITMGGNLVNYPGDCGTPKGRPPHSETAPQQHDLHSKPEIHDIGPQRLLSHDPHEAIRVF
jgi:hypothetical protein